MTEDGTNRTPRWPWGLLALGAVWVVLIRVPLVLNARHHLDSDLAVDGFTLLEATEGRWRWHYPGTPHIGTAAVALSWPQAMIWGPTPVTLVSGGTVAALGLLIGCFLLTWRAFGPAAAAWSLAPLVFASNGAVWLSGRITGGHLLIAAWHAGAFALSIGLMRRGGWSRAIVLGLWCGLGLSIDSMFAVTLAGLLPITLLSPFLGSRSGGKLGVTLVGFLVGLSIGLIPREVGKRIEPHNAYGPQFE
ncbi:MAG: hypothetical protein AB7I30_11330, partial [Isosphaeraceae bacterium]